MPGIYAAGDIVDYEGKVKLIATGFGEVATAVNNAFAYLNPGKSAFPGHLSDYAPEPGRARPGRLAHRLTPRRAASSASGSTSCPVARFAATLASARRGWPQRLFTAAERMTAGRCTAHRRSRWPRASRPRRPWPRRWAPAGGMLWTDAEVLVDDGGRPSVIVRGTVAARAESLGVTRCTCRSRTTAASPRPPSSPSPDGQASACVGCTPSREVRAAEDALMARLPDGALMARAAPGLAVECARLLGRVYGRPRRAARRGRQQRRRRAVRRRRAGPARGAA